MDLDPGNQMIPDQQHFNPRLTETEKTRHFLILREKLGIDRPLVVTNNRNTVKSREFARMYLVKSNQGISNLESRFLSSNQ